MANDQLSSEQLVFKHLIKMHDFTDELSYKEYGFAARRIALKLINIYTLLQAVLNKVAYIEREELLEVTDICNKFCAVMVKNQQLHYISFSMTTNQHTLLMQREITYIIQVWNKLCLKI